jgi:hypothetical protein
MENKLIGLKKQNDSIYNSLISRNILFERTIFLEGIDDNEYFNLLNEENNRLKECVKNNKPEQIIKQKKEKKQEEKKEKKEEKREIDEEEIYEDPVKKIDIIINMEELKRAFFNSEYEVFESNLKDNKFRYFKANYRYNSDKDNAPEFSAKNLLGGFVRNFDDFRKYFMICFRCWKINCEEVKYEYDSLWIVNTNESISTVVGDTFCENFDFEEINDLDKFIEDFKKINNLDETNCIGESYVH